MCHDVVYDVVVRSIMIGVQSYCVVLYVYYDGLYSVLIARVMHPYLIDVWCMCGVQSHDVVCYYILVAFTTI